jgi:hypothetical protein
MGGQQIAHTVRRSNALGFGMPLFNLPRWSVGFAFIGICLLGVTLRGETVFIEAETLTASSDGWRSHQNSQTRGASAVRALNGAIGDSKGVADSALIHPENPGHTYRIWVRYGYHGRFRGPFSLAAIGEQGKLGREVFDLKPETGAKDWEYVWRHFEVTARGPFKLQVAKHLNRNCTSYVRNVDCFLVTDDLDLVPDHLPYGPQTWLRVSLADVYQKPLQIHIFADHHRSPWYGHWHLSKAGAAKGLRPSNEQLLASGERTPWCNITPMLYQDAGAILNITARYTYAERAERLKATFEFATAPKESAIIRTMKVDSVPNGLVIAMPPNLVTEENLSRFKRDREFAEATGKIADAFPWPTIGKKPERFPFFVSATVTGYGTPVDQSVQDREWKTLGYFGFSNREKHALHGRVWRMFNRSYCEPDLATMRKNTALYRQQFAEAGHRIEDIAHIMLTDEPTGQPTAFMATSPSYLIAFRNWLKTDLGKTPADLLVRDWTAVKPVPDTERETKPALYYFTQRFRTRALGDFMAVQKEILEEAYGGTFPTTVNFSDGATYSANFYSQGVDYFELLDDDQQNAIWSEDWANGSSSYQCGAYNVDLLRAAARDRQQTIGHYVIAHAHRKSWDIKTKVAGETARGVRIWQNFSYGTSWGSHEGGPSWKSHTWYNHPEVWRANAETVREIGTVEDLILDAVANPAEVAIVYSSSTDAWVVGRNHAYGFNRMHNWMALAHAQIPVDFVAERQVARGQLSGRKVCYLSGPNLTRAAALKLRDWVKAGGTLFLSAGAAMRDEFNRPLDIISDIAPAQRAPIETVQPFRNSGSYVHILKSIDTVDFNGTRLEVLSVRQKQSPKKGATSLARFADGSSAVVRAHHGKGVIYSAGFLPALDYIKQAEVARRALIAQRDDALKKAALQGEHPAPAVQTAESTSSTAGDPRIDRSYNPWDFSARVREFLLTPVRTSGVTPELTCDVALIDAIALRSAKGLVIPLANHTLVPQKNVRFGVRTGKRVVARVESVHQGPLDYTQEKAGIISFSLPLEASDYVQVYFAE